MVRQSRWDFAKFVERRGAHDCWPWKGSVSSTGHPRFGAEGTQWYVHRLVYEKRHGPIPAWPDMVVMHLCNSPSCCNPDHLYLGTQADNMEHAGLSGTLSRKGEANGNSKLTDVQVAAIKADLRPSRTIAADYGIEKTQILRIKKGVQRRG